MKFFNLIEWINIFWKNKKVLKKEYICFSVTDEEKQIIKKLAGCQKKSIDDFMRYVIFSKYIDDFIR